MDQETEDTIIKAMLDKIVDRDLKIDEQRAEIERLRGVLAQVEVDAGCLAVGNLSRMGRQRVDSIINRCHQAALRGDAGDDV